MDEWPCRQCRHNTQKINEYPCKYCCMNIFADKLSREYGDHREIITESFPREKGLIKGNELWEYESNQ
jgi:hypothetical protein